MRKSMLAKKFFINTGINITVKTNNGSYSRWRNPSHHYDLPPNFTVFLAHWGDKLSPSLLLTNLCHQIQTSWIYIHHESELYSIFPLSTGYALWRSQDEPFDFSLKSKVCDMESRSLIFPYLTNEKQFFSRLVIVVLLTKCTRNSRCCIGTVF